ncbi:uroporphyrinogen-III C-methyltransferase [Larsenimonas rhizosphaerae]|uniref:uroporphyrinogen-III C-methyltransferase n=1 Tax=Larsenimonas rhizosphaerae TaxID=2944682 RepID=UPI002AFF093A|nr:uroporphyrinogen-III C-methyltransferase [Larsenimonas rhizosphaerae]
MDVLTVHYTPTALRLRLLGEGRRAEVLARQWVGLGVTLTLHPRQPPEASLSALLDACHWQQVNTPPAPAPGDIWVIAHEQPEDDLVWLDEAERAGVPVFAPGFPDRSTVHLPGRYVQGQPVRPGVAGRGRVTLVGAGPGDPGLLTQKAAVCLRDADVIVHDRLVSREILALASPDAQRFYVGKERSNHSVAQDDINDSLARWARAGYHVVRLKGGDPFIFGRGGEELEVLAREGVPFEVVPGITAALGVSACTGIPLTHRDHAQSVRFITGHLKNGSCDLDWPTLAHPGQTLVFYMGLGTLSAICDNLISHGASPERPIALVEQGTTARQQVHVGTLAGIAEQIKSLVIAPPTLIIVGDVVSLHETLAWFDPETAPSLGWSHGKHPTPSTT